VRLLLVVFVALLLAGCATRSPEADGQGQAQADVETSAKDSARCQSYGLKPGTPEFEKCLAQLADKRAQAEANGRASLGNRLLGQPPTWASH
jgi:hypothetical protein